MSRRLGGGLAEAGQARQAGPRRGSCGGVVASLFPGESPSPSAPSAHKGPALIVDKIDDQIDGDYLRKAKGPLSAKIDDKINITFFSKVPSPLFQS